MKRANLYQTDSKDLVVVTQNPNEGWVFCLFRLQKNKTIRILNTSHMNMSGDFKKIITDLFPNNSNFSQNVFPHKPTAPKFKLIKDVSKMVMAYDYTPYEPFDVDLSAQLLHEYVDIISSDPLKCEEFKNNIKTSLLGKRKMSDHNPWASSTLDQARLKDYESPLKKTELLYQIKEKSQLFKDMIAFLEVDNPLVKHKNILLFGPAATGKTTVAETIATYYNLPYASLVGNSRMEAEDLAGSITIAIDDDGDSAWVSQYTNLLQVAGAGGICLIDEVLQLSGNAQASTNSMLFGTQRSITFQGKSYPIHPNTIFIAATNVGYEGVGHANFAFKDRFRPFKTNPLTRSEISDYYKLVFKKVLKAPAINKYVDLCFDVDTYLENNYSDTDEFNLERPQLTVRRMNDMLGEILAKVDVETVLRSTLEGIMNSDSFSSSDISVAIDYFRKKISDLEDALFANSAYIQEANDLAMEVNKLTHMPKKPITKASKATKVNKGNGKITLNLDDPNAWDDSDEDEDEDSDYTLELDDHEDLAENDSLDLLDEEEDKKIKDALDEADALVGDLE